MSIRIHKQRAYSFIISYLLSFSALLSLCNGLLNAIGLQTVLDTVLLYGLMFGLIISGFLMSLIHGERIELDVFVILSFFALCYLISMLLFSENRALLFTSWVDYSKNPLYLIFVYSLPGYIFARKLTDYECFESIMRLFSYTVVILSILVFVFVRDSSASQYMTFSYNMLTQLLFLMFKTPRKRKVLHYVIVGLGLCAFVLGGARGALVSLVIATAWLYMSKQRNGKRLIVGISIVLIGLIVALLKNEVLLLLSNLLNKLSIDSRTIRYLIDGDFLNDSSRLNLFASSREAVGLLGKGLMGDRAAIGSYPHNLLLEIAIQYGALLGAVLIILLLICIGRSLFSKKTSEYIWIVMLLPCGFIKLLITGSYLNQEPAFYILLALCVNAIIRRNEYAVATDKYSLR